MFNSWEVLAQDLSAQDSYDKIIQSLTKTKNWNADMEIVLKEAGEIVQEMKGNLSTAAQFSRIDLGNYIVFSDGNNSWTVDKEYESIAIQSISDAAPSILQPADLLTSLLDEGFRMKLRDKSNPYILDFIPADQSSLYSKIQLVVNEAFEPLEISVFQRDGMQSFMKFSNINRNPLQAEALQFHATDYPEYQLEDLRLD